MVVPFSHLELLYPESVSPLLKDFLNQCCTVSPSLRPTAQELLRHRALLSAGDATDMIEVALEAKKAKASSGL